MRQSLTRPGVGQLGPSRLSLPPPRAISGSIPAQNPPSAPQAAQPAPPGLNPAVQAPTFDPVALQAPLPQTPPTLPSTISTPGITPSVHLGAMHLVNGSAEASYSNAPQVNRNALPAMAPNDLSQRVLMDYLALVQSQVAAMNQVVASTVAHNQALTAQNQALFEELRALKQHVEGLANAGQNRAAVAVESTAFTGVAPAAAAPLPGPPPPQGVQAPQQQAPAQISGGDVVVAAGIPMKLSHGSSIAAAAVTAGAPSAPAPAAAAAVAEEPMPSTRSPEQPSPPPPQLAPAPVAQTAAVSSSSPSPPTDTVAAVQPTSRSVPTLAHQGTPPAPAVAAAPASDDDTHLQLLSLVAFELQNLSEAAKEPGFSDGAAEGSVLQPTTSAGTASPDTLAGRVIAAELMPVQSSSVPPPPKAAVAPAAAPAAVVGLEHVAAAAASLPARTTRPPGRGGRYVGPPRANWYHRAVPSVAGRGSASAGVPSWRGAAPANGAQPGPEGGTGAVGTGGPAASNSGVGAAVADKWEATATGGRRAAADRSGKQVGVVPTAAAAPSCPGNGAVTTVLAGAHTEPGFSAAAAELAVPTAAMATEKRIRRSCTAEELRAVVEEDRLSPQLAVLAAQQLPRIVRLAQERQQQQQLQELPAAAAAGAGAAASKAVEGELLAARELFLRLLARFSSPSAVAALRPAFLHNYLALAAVSSELRQPPSRAFAGAVRQLVTQHVAELTPDLAAAGVAAIAQLDGTVAPGVLERACKVVTEELATVAVGGAAATAPPRLIGWKALTAAGQLAPLGRVATEAAGQVLSGAAAAAASVGDRGGITVAEAAVAPPKDLGAEALVSAAQGVLACSAAGVAVPPVLLQPLEASSRHKGVLAAVGPSGQLLVAKAFLAAGHQPQDAWLDMLEAEVVDNLARASPAQVAALAAALHALAGVGVGVGGTHSRRGARHNFVAAASERLLAAGPGAGMSSGASACALALHIGELATGGGGDGSAAGHAAVPPSGATRLAAALLSVAAASLASLDLPDLAALVSGLSLLGVRAPAEVWSALLSRATDAPAVAVAATVAARRALELGLPAGIKLASLEHFLSVASKHVGDLPAASLVGLMGLAAAVKSKLRPGLVAAMVTRLYDLAMTLGSRDVAFLFAAVDALSLPLTEAMAARPLAAVGGTVTAFKEDIGRGDSTATAAASLSLARVLHRTAEAALVPEQVLADLGLGRTAQLLEVVARLQQTVALAAAGPTAVAAAEGSSASVMGGDGRMGKDGGDGAGGDDSSRLIPRGQVLALLRLTQSSLPEASPAALAALAGSAAALELSVPSGWLDAVVEATLAEAPRLDPMTWSRIAAAVTRCEQLAGVSPGSAGGGWLDAFVDDMQRKLAAAPPAALALTLQVLVAHGRQPSAAWTVAFLAAAMPSLEAPLPLTQAQAAGASAAAASVAASRAQTTGQSKVTGRTSPLPPRTGHAPASQLPQPPGQMVESVQGPVATAFTLPQLAQLLSGLAALQIQQYVTPAWLAAAVRQVEGRAVHFSYRDLAEALYGIVRLGGSVRDAVCNQLFIVSQARLAAAPPALLSRTLAVAAGGAGCKISAKWWEEAQKALVAKLGDSAAVLAPGEKPPAASAAAAAGAVWQTDDLSMVIDSVLALRRRKDEANIDPALAVVLGSLVSYGGGGVVAATLSPDTAVSYVEACGELPQLGHPPVVLLERYLSYSLRLLAKCAGAEQAAALHELAKQHQQQQQPESSGASSSGKGGAREKRERKRARERAPKYGGAAAAAAAVAAPLLEHLQSAVTVGKMLVGIRESERPPAATPWLAALTAAGAAVAPSLPVSYAADVLWLLAKLKAGEATGSGAAIGGATTALATQVEALAARVGASGGVAEASSSVVAAAPTVQQQQQQQQQLRLSLDAVVDTVWALRSLAVPPGEGLLHALAIVLPGRLASLPPLEALQLLQALADAGAIGNSAVAEAETVAMATAGHGRAAAAAGTPASSPARLATEVGRFLGAHLPEVKDDYVVDFLAAAATLELPLPSAVTAAAATRLAAAAAAGSLRGVALLNAVQSLRYQGAAPPPEELEPLCDAVAEGALDGTIGGVLQIAQVAASLYDMGARPGPEWLGVVGEAVLDDLAGGTSSHGGVRRPPLTARGLIIALNELATRFQDNYVTLAMAACRAAMEDLEGQLAVAEGALVPQPLEQRPGWGWMVPAAAAAATELPSTPFAADEDLQQQQQQQQQEEGVEVAEEEQLAEEEVMALDPALLQPLDLEDVVQLLVGLSEAKQEPPEEFWELLERALRPALQQQQQQQRLASHDSGGGDGKVPLLEVNDQALCGLLENMPRLGAHVSEAFLQDLESYLSRRMKLQGGRMLAALATHCLVRGHVPEPQFMRLFRERIEEVVPAVDTQPALLLLKFLAVEFMTRSREQTAPSTQQERALEKQQTLLQGLMSCTRAEDLLTFPEVTGEDAREVVILLTFLMANFGLSPPGASSTTSSTSSDRSSGAAAWLTALQALSLGCMDQVGWSSSAILLRVIRDCGLSPQPDWLAAYYKGLESAAATAPPHDLADAAAAAASASYQPALAPMLPARLGAALEKRLREFASTDPRVIFQLLTALGLMGYVVRTEVLQAAEALLAEPLGRAPEVLKEVHVSLKKPRSESGGDGSRAEAGSEADDDRLAAAAGAAEELVRQETLYTVCMALRAHAYRPGPRLVDALMGAAWVLHCGTGQHVVEMEAQRKRGGQMPAWPSLAWSNVSNLGNVLIMLSDWGAQPSEPWRDGAAQALTAVAMLGDQPNNRMPELVNGELAAMLVAVAALERWGHRLSEQQVLALEHAVELQVHLCQEHGFPVDQQLLQVLATGLEDRLEKAKKHSGAGGGSAAAAAEAEAQSPKSWSTSSDPVAFGGSNFALGDLVGMFGPAGPAAAAAAAAVRPGEQQGGPVMPAEYREYRDASNRHEEAVRPTEGFRPQQHQQRQKQQQQQRRHYHQQHQQVVKQGEANGLVTAAEAAEAILETAHATEEPRGQRKMEVATETEVGEVAGSREAAADVVMLAEQPVVAAAVESTAAAEVRKPAVARVAELPSSSTSSSAAAAPVDASSTRVSFRRLTPAERAAATAAARVQRAAATGLAPPVPPPTPTASTASEARTRAAISQLLQLMPQSSRPLRRASKLPPHGTPVNAAADDDDDDDGDVDEDEDAGAESTAARRSGLGRLGRLAAATAARAAAAAVATNKPSFRRPNSSSGKTGGTSGGIDMRGGAPFAGKPHNAAAIVAAARRRSSSFSSSFSSTAAAAGRPAALDPTDPSTWNLLDQTLDSALEDAAAAGSGPVQVPRLQSLQQQQQQQQQQPQQRSGSQRLPVVEPEVLEP